MPEEFNFDECPNQRFILPYLILELHKLGGEARKRDVVDGLANLFDLSDEIREEKTPKGHLKFDTTVAFARLQLKHIDYIDSKAHGVWQLTQRGREAIKELDSREAEILNAFRKEADDERKKIQEKRRKEREADPGGELPEQEFEEDEIEIRLMQDLNKIKSIDPYAFERLCVQLLRTSNYEGVDVTKRSKDGGIDGFGYLTIDLIRFKIVFQAKRYRDTSKVGPDHIDALFGAQHRANAEKALLITTSDFTQEAKKRALELGIELIDGRDLMRHLFEKEIGYRKILDDDFLKNL